MDDAIAWRKEQLAEVKELQDYAKKWRTELKKEARAWRDTTLREFNNWRYEIRDEIEMLKGEAKDGYKKSAGKSDKTEADNTPGRKRRSSTSRISSARGQNVGIPAPDAQDMWKTWSAAYIKVLKLYDEDLDEHAKEMLGEIYGITSQVPKSGQT